jgi:hypothetical protein
LSDDKAARYGPVSRTGASAQTNFYGDRTDHRADLTDAEIDELLEIEVEEWPGRNGEKWIRV